MPTPAPDDLLHSVLAALAGAAATGGGFWTWLRWVGRRRPDIADGQTSILTAQAAFQRALNEQAQAFTATLLKLTGEQQATIDRLEQRVQELEADNRRCHGENRNLRAALAALMRRLKAAGIDLPDELRLTAILETETEDGAVTALTGLTQRPRTPKR